MIDPLLPPRAAERLAALRPPVQAQKRRKPAHTSKILTAGISTTALLGLVTAMGWPTSVGNAQTAAPVAPDTTPLAQLLPITPAATPTVPAVVVAPSVAPAPATLPATLPPTVPATAAPVVTQAPVVIPVAIPVARPVVKKARRAVSNTVTKTSG